jgi:hypothetical protein
MSRSMHTGDASTCCTPPASISRIAHGKAAPNLFIAAFGNAGMLGSHAREMNGVPHVDRGLDRVVAK